MQILLTSLHTEAQTSTLKFMLKTYQGKRILACMASLIKDVYFWAWQWQILITNTLAGSRKPFQDEDGVIHWPLIFVYPETMQNDIVEDAKETDTLKVLPAFINHPPYMKALRSNHEAFGLNIPYCQGKPTFLLKLLISWRLIAADHQNLKQLNQCLDVSRRST